MTTETEGNLQGSADSISADLSAAFDSSVEAETTQTESNPVSEAARTLAAARVGKVDSAEGTEKPLDAQTPTEAAVAELLEAPQHWPAPDRERFGALGKAPDGRSWQEWILGRHKSMEADYTRKTQEFSGIRRLKEQLDEIMAPYREQMAREGIDDATAIRQLFAAHTYMQQQPQEAFKWLAQKYGFDLQNLNAQGGAESTGQLPPAFTQLQQTVTQLEKRLHDEAQRTQQEQHNARLNQVEQFATEKDAQGNLKRPHFDEVAGEIALLIKASREQKQELSLQDAYDRAVFANPVTRQKVLAAQDAQRKAKEDAERKAKADAAKKAGFDVKGEGAASNVAATTNSVRADLEAAFATAGARV